MALGAMSTSDSPCQEGPETAALMWVKESHTFFTSVLITLLKNRGHFSPRKASQRDGDEPQELWLLCRA